MQTRLLDDPLEAAQIVREGGLVAFPTETVFGLGADATRVDAIGKLYHAKGRPSDNPLIVHLANQSQLPTVVRRVPDSARRLLEAFAPGPLTVVLPKRDSIIDSVTAGLDTVGVRIPAHDLARAFLQAADLPIAAPSANRSGKPSGTTVQAVWEDLGGRIDAILVGETSPIGLESTVVDCGCQPPRLLRPGAITIEQLQGVVGHVELLTTQPSSLDNSPGLRHAHYRPAAEVRLIDCPQQIRLEDPSNQSGYLGLEPLDQPCNLGLYRRFESIEQYAREFYESLRVADRLGLKVIYCQTVPTTGVGQALTDRLHRAASRADEHQLLGTSCRRTNSAASLDT